MVRRKSAFISRKLVRTRGESQHIDGRRGREFGVSWQIGSFDSAVLEDPE